MKGFDKQLRRLFFFKQLLIFYSLKIPSPDEEREVDLGTFVDQEEGDIDDESDVELDLDLDSEHNDDDLALFRLFPSASLLVAHLGLNPVRVS